jgi:drug/metabolite transporter (DMT)-like permease
LGTRWVPAAQVALLALTETILAPTWVWMIYDERPASLALIGGLVVLVAVAAEGVAGLRRAKRAAALP